MRTATCALLALLLLSLGGAAAVRAQSTILENFEGKTSLFEDQVAGFERVTAGVKEGRTAGRWEPARSRTGNLRDIPAQDLIITDWTSRALAFWLYSKRANGDRVRLVIRSENATTDEPDFYALPITLNWEGWRRFRVAQSEIGNRLQVSGRPRGWSVITGLQFQGRYAGNEPKESTVLLVDALQLEMADMSGLRTVTLAPTRTGNYTYWPITESGLTDSGAVSMLTPQRKTARIPLTRETREIQVLDEGNGTLAIIPVTGIADGATIRVAPQDFKRVRLLVVKVTGEDGKPVASAVVTLTDVTGKRAQRVLIKQDEGSMEFRNVLMGRTKFTAVHGTNGPRVTHEMNVAPGEGGAPTAVRLVLAGDVPTITPRFTGGSGVTAAGPNLPSVAAVPVEANGPDWVAGVVGLAILAALGYFGLRAARTRGVTVEQSLRRIGVEMPQDAADHAPTGIKSIPENLPPLPPLSDLPPAAAAALGTQAPPDAGSAPRPSLQWPWTSSEAAATVSAPRLVGLEGPATGAVIVLESGSSVSIGRDAASSLALTQDTTVSRRHARIEARPDTGFILVDEGSRNGTFINGVRTQEQTLSPGDVIQIGSARFRFEG